MPQLYTLAAVSGVNGLLLTCKCTCFVSGHSPKVTQVTFIAHQHDDDVAVCVVSELLKPALHILIGQVLGDVIH